MSGTEENRPTNLRQRAAQKRAGAKAETTSRGAGNVATPKLTSATLADSVRPTPAGTNPASPTSTWAASRLARQRRTHPTSGTKSSKRARVLARVLNVPLTYLSASVVVALSAFMVGAYLLLTARDVVTVTVIVAILILANGWSGLVHCPTRYAPAATAVLVGIPTVFAVRFTGDMAWATVGAGLTVLAAALMEMSRPLPRTDLVQSISASVSAGLAVAVGSAWVALTASPLWSAIMVSSAVVMAITVIGNQLGSTLAANSIGAIVSGTVAGGVLGFIAIGMGQHHSIVSLIVPQVLTKLPEQVAIIIVGAVMGACLAVTIALVDAVLGEHSRRCSEAGAFARGALKFLLAAMPIYMIVRIGVL